MPIDNSTPLGMFTRGTFYTEGNVRRTKSLFKEYTVLEDKFSPVFTVGKTLYPEGLVNLKELYIKFCVEDPTEVVFAEVVFGDYTFWEYLQKAPWFQDDLREWRTIVEVKRKSEAFKHMVKEVKDGGRSAYSAAKFLIEEPWKDKRNPKTKKESKSTTNKASLQVKSDVERLREEGLIN